MRYKENGKLEKRFKSRLPRKTKKEIQKKNRCLCQRYPFLLPRNVWTGKVVENYNYTWTEADCFEPGWWKRFGIPLCEDLREVLLKYDYLEKFRFSQIKEKYGSLCLYDFGAPKEWNEHLYAWEYISEHTCVRCGAFPVKMRDDGWVSPYCDSCFSRINKNASKEQLKKMTVDDTPLEEFLTYQKFSKDGSTEYKVDLKPYYLKIGYKFQKD